MFLFLLFLLFLVWIFNEIYWKRRNLPQGPLPFPIIGNMLDIAMNPPGYDSHLKWTKQYGPVYTFYMGTMPMVAVTEFKALQESFIQDGDSYVDRHRMENFIHVLRSGDYGVVETNGDLWKEQRRFTLQTFRNFGMGKNLMQEKILDEVLILISNLRNDLNCDINISKHIDVCIGSIINSILFGYRFDESKVGEFYQLKQYLSDNIKLVGNPLTIVAMANLHTIGRLPYFSGLIQKSLHNIHSLFAFFDRQIEEHEMELELDSHEEPSDYCESYLREMHKNQPGSYFSKPQLRNMCMDLWAAGLETTANTLSWAILYFLHNPDVQTRVQEELEAIIGSDRLITVDDKPRLPYVNAFISETQRCCNLLPQNLIRKTSKDVIIAGHKIPQGTSITPQISCVLYDEKVIPTDLYKLPTLEKRLGFTVNPQPFTCKLTLRKH